MNLTGLSPWNSTGGAQRAGTAITAKHVVYAAHFALGVGATIRFVTAGNVVVTRTIAAETVIVDPTGGGNSDLVVARLDSVLPGTIQPLRLMPESVAEHYQCPPDDEVRVVVVDQEEKALVYFVTRSEPLPPAPPNFQTMVYGNADEDWGEDIVGGDSGSPMFAIVNGQAVLWSHRTGSGGPAYHRLISEIQTVVEADGQSLTFADLTGFDTIH